MNTKTTNLNVNDKTNLANNDNSLNIIVKTTNQHVETTTTKIAKEYSATIKGYLGKFVFNNYIANKNQDFVMNTGIQPNLTKTSAVDFSQGQWGLSGLSIEQAPAFFTIGNLLTQINTPANELKITNAVIANLNLGYEQHILNKHLQSLITKLPDVAQGSTNLIKDTSSNEVFNIYERTSNFPQSVFVHKDKSAYLGEDNDVFIQIKVSNWAYLSKNDNKFICPKYTFIYGFLGATSTS